MIELFLDHTLKSARLDLELTSLHDDDGAVSYQWVLSNRDKTEFEGVARLVLKSQNSEGNWWPMIPGLFYGENRRVGQRVGAKRYPRFDPSTVEPSHDDMISNYWDFSADKTAMPMVLLHDGDQWLGLAGSPHFEVFQGDAELDCHDEPQIGVGFAVDENTVQLRLNVPGCDEPFTHSNRTDRQATIRRLRLSAGASIGGELVIYRYKANRDGYRQAVRHFRDKLTSDPSNAPAASPEIRPAMHDAVHGVIQGHYDEKKNLLFYSRPYDPVIEQVANGRGTTFLWAQMLTGFVGVIPVCRGLLRAAYQLGDDKACDVATRLLDRVCKEGVSPSGLFWAGYTPKRVETAMGEMDNPIFGNRESEWGSGWYPGGDRVHARTVSEASAELAGLLLDMHNSEAFTDPLPTQWVKALKQTLETALTLQLEDGTFGQVYDGKSGEVVESMGCGGLPWLTAAGRARRLGILDSDMEQRWAEACQRAAKGYQAYLDDAVLWGAPEDNDSPSSEDGLNALTAFAEWYRWTGEMPALDLAQRSADWMLTFRRTFNQRLPEQSLMGRYSLRSRGGELASSCNNHLHVYGAMATTDLLALSKWTGDPVYASEAHAMWCFTAQYLSRCDGMFNGFRGAMAEQFYWTDWGSWSGWPTPAYHHQKGNMAPLTAVWVLGVLLNAGGQWLEHEPTHVEES